MSKATHEKQEQSTAQETDFNGKPILALSPTGSKYSFKFGAWKARLIVKHLDAIMAFDAKHNKKEAAATA